jgi:hypothetical protein
MKRLQDYLNKNFDSIYENFEADHILTEEEINQSFDRIVTEGFWSWLGDLIKSLFSDDTSKETKDYISKTLTYFREEWGEDAEKITTKLLQEKDVKKFLKRVEEERVKLLDSKKIKDEEQSYCWAIFTLKQKIKLLTDEKKTSDIKLIEEKIKEYSKKAGNRVTQIEQEIENIEVPQEQTGPEPPTQEFGEAMTTVMGDNGYKKELEVLCKYINTTPETLQNILYTICKENNELKGIKEPDKIFGLCVILIGGYLAQNIPSDRDMVITKFNEVTAVLMDPSQNKKYETLKIEK